MQILIVILLIGLLLISGCGYDKEAHIKERNKLISISQNICNSKGQSYLMHYTSDLEEWKVICFQISPFKSFEYEINT